MSGNLSLGNFKRSDSSSVLHLHSNDAPPALHHAVSDPISLANKQSTAYEVRPCRVEDTDSIDTIMRCAWPDEPEWRNPQYWTKQFIKPTSERFGYVIEEISNNHDENKDTGSQYSKVTGFSMYKWKEPSHQISVFRYGYGWYCSDFDTKNFEWKNGFNHDTSTVGGYNNLYYNNQNLKENWKKLSTHIVHITDVAIHPHHRGKGLGTQLLQSMIYSFPSGTRFGLEVKCDNFGGVKCYQKCAFEIKQKMPHYYGRGKPAYKMVLISNYTDEDVSNFVKTTQLKRSQKERQNIQKQLENFHIHNVKSKVNKYNEQEQSEQKGKEDVEMIDKEVKQNEKIMNALKRLCGDDWQFYFQRFCIQEIYDNDLINLSEDELKHLIPKIGPRSRIREWINKLKNHFEVV